MYQKERKVCHFSHPRKIYFQQKVDIPVEVFETAVVFSAVFKVLGQVGQKPPLETTVGSTAVAKIMFFTYILLIPIQEGTSVCMYTESLQIQCHYCS